MPADPADPSDPSDPSDPADPADLVSPTLDAVQTLAGRRLDYRRDGLMEQDAGNDPYALFAKWFADASQAQAGSPEEPHAMSLATVDREGIPSIRTVLLKGFNDDGFVWFTNYESRKGSELLARGVAALNFRWGVLERQVSVRGTVSRTTDDESNAYFASRPAGSQIGAIVSPQSRVIANRSVLEDAAATLASGPASAIVRPAYWGGFRLVATEIEFWQGRSSRLHDRIRFCLLPDGGWVRERLGP